MRNTRCNTLSLCLSLLLTLARPDPVHGQKFRNGFGQLGYGRSLQADEGLTLRTSLMVPTDNKDGDAFGLEGDTSCPCLSSEALATDFPPYLISEVPIEDKLWPGVNISTYGHGCTPHEADSPQCTAAFPEDCATITPSPPGCDKSLCPRSWCFVDPKRCAVLSRPSTTFEGRHFSYAACGYMDSSTYTERLASLRGRTLRVALNSNTGGWKGAYNPSGSFAVDARWEGPVVGFIRNAALEGGFSINVTRPPEWLRAESAKFFGKSSFDYCVYAAALGYVDLCVASYTITDKRASVTPFFETDNNAIYVVVFEQEGAGATWESFRTAFLTIFQPFTWDAWLFIVLFCLPILGLLTFFYEWKAPGSSFPPSVPVALQDVRTRRVRECTGRKVSPLKHMADSVYMSFLAFFQESYDQSVVTIAAKINIIALSSFILLVLAVYTANLAAILTTDTKTTNVANLEEAVAAGYNFCSERKVSQLVIDLHGLDPSLIVPDPVDLGGDGRPGFNCPKCNARSRVFEYMRKTADDKSLYCNAALASWEDLQVLHQGAEHCDKTRVGEVLGFQNTGVPLYADVASSLFALFHRMKGEGRVERELSAAQPESQCPEKEGEEGHALTVEQLTGIWIITFTLAVAALLTKFVQRCSMRRRQLRRGMPSRTRVRVLQRYDQWNNPTDHDVFIGGERIDPDSVKNELSSGEGMGNLMGMSAYSLSHRGELKGAKPEDSGDSFEPDQ